MNDVQFYSLSQLNLDALLKHVRGHSTSLSSRLHGANHWLRVTQAGFELAKHVPDCDLMIVFLFGLLHDTQRLRDGHDPQHGERAAKFVEHMNNNMFSLSDDQLNLLTHACHYHEKGQVSDQPTIGICWDADRLNLWRVKMIPMSRFLSTSPAKTWHMRWQALRLQFQHVTWHDLHREYIVLAESQL